MSAYVQTTASPEWSLRGALASDRRRAPWRPLAKAAARALILVVVSIAANLVTPRAQAEQSGLKRVAAFVKPAEMKSGALLLKSENDRFLEAPLVGTDVDVTVSGPTARARVTQIFHNPTDGWVEAVYVYPLSEGAAVDTLKMVVGERVVIGDIKARKQAREIYEQAKATGQKAALTEQERPNIFTNSVANIGPHETVVVQIEYQEPVRQSGDEFSCACRWLWRRAIAPLRSCRRSRCRLTAEAGARSTIRCRTATASRRRCSIRAATRRSIPSPSRCVCRPAFRSARSKATTTPSPPRPSPTTFASSSSTGRCRPTATSS